MVTIARKGIAHATVPLSCSNFSGKWASINKRQRMRLTIADLARATFCLGNTDLFRDTMPNRALRGAAAIFVTEMVTRRGADLWYSNNYDSADEQLQRTSAYLVGTALAKIFCERALRAPWAIPIKYAKDNCRLQYRS